MDQADVLTKLDGRIKDIAKKLARTPAKMKQQRSVLRALLYELQAVRRWIEDSDLPAVTPNEGEEALGE